MGDSSQMYWVGGVGNMLDLMCLYAVECIILNLLTILLIVLVH